MSLSERLGRLIRRSPSPLSYQQLGRLLSEPQTPTAVVGGVEFCPDGMRFVLKFHPRKPGQREVFALVRDMVGDGKRGDVQLTYSIGRTLEDLRPEPITEAPLQKIGSEGVELHFFPIYKGPGLRENFEAMTDHVMSQDRIQATPGLDVDPRFIKLE